MSASAAAPGTGGAPSAFASAFLTKARIVTPQIQTAWQHWRTFSVPASFIIIYAFGRHVRSTFAQLKESMPELKALKTWAQQMQAHSKGMRHASTEACKAGSVAQED